MSLFCPIRVLAFHVLFQVGEVAPAARTDTLADTALDLGYLAPESCTAAVGVIQSIVEAVVFLALPV